MKMCKIYGLLLASVIVCGQLLGALTIADNRQNGFWRRPSVYWKTGDVWESHEIGRTGATELPAECEAFYVSIPDKYVRETNYFFRFDRSKLLEHLGYETYVLRWTPDDRMSPLWLVAIKDKNSVRYCKAKPVYDPRLRLGTTTALSVYGATAHTVPK